MNNLQAVIVLERIKTHYTKNLPKWYETATDEEKKEFDAKNAERVEALTLAINLLMVKSKLEKLNEQAQKASEFISELLKDFVDEVE